MYGRGRELSGKRGRELSLGCPGVSSLISSEEENIYRRNEGISESEGKKENINVKEAGDEISKKAAASIEEEMKVSLSNC